MLSLKDIREYVDSLGIAENVYIGKMDNKKPKSIGVYNRPASGPPRTTLGGPEYGTYRINALAQVRDAAQRQRILEQELYEKERKEEENV